MSKILFLHIFMIGSITSIPTSSSQTQPKQGLCDLGCECHEGQSLIFLDCSRQGITSLPSSLQLESSLSSLSFRSNHLQSLEVGTFSKADELQELDFALNAISRIDKNTFIPLGSLTRLSLSHNRLPELGPGVLEGLFNLRVLELSHNVITKISHLAFETTPRLQELRLQYNPIFKLEHNTFRYLPHLEKLDLQDTGLVMLHPYIFRPTPRLHWLSLATNAFESVPEEALAQAPNLEILNLSENDFTVLAEGAFKRLSHISVLYLNNLDRLTQIEKDAFAGLVNLKSLSCSYNKKLRYIDQEVFGALNSTDSKSRTPPREQLYLRQNGLKTLQSPMEHGTWSKLSFVDLAENPWKCDCQLLWMLELKMETQISIRCDSPRQLAGRTLDTIQPSELRCGGRWEFATAALVLSSIVALSIIMVSAAAVVCSRTRLGLYVRAKQQFSYSKVQPKTEVVDLEWDPSADMQPETGLVF